MAVPTGVKPNISTKTVATAGTRIQLSATDLIVEWFRVESVAGTIFLGDVTVVSTLYMAKLAAGIGYDMKPPGDPNNARGVNGKCFNLKHWYIDSVGNGDKAQLTYFQRLNDGV